MKNCLENDQKTKPVISRYRICIAVFLFLSSLLPVHAAQVTVAVAANFTEAARELAQQFETASGNRVKLSFGSTGQLYAQISNGAPYEVFLAADAKRPMLAEKSGIAVNGSRFTYAEGTLVLVSLDKTGLENDAAAFLKSDNYKRLAIANPDTAPYGYAAKQVLEKLGLWQKLQPKIVRGNSVAQTYQFVATGNAGLGFIAQSQVTSGKQDAPTNNGPAFASTWVVPASDYDPIEQQAVLLKHGDNSDAAKAFMQFLKSDAARNIIIRHGYTIPSAQDKY